MSLLLQEGVEAQCRKHEHKYSPLIAKKCLHFDVNSESITNMITYVFENTDTCVVSALRRILLQEVDAYAYNPDNDDIEIVNFSRYNTYTLKQRVEGIKILTPHEDKKVITCNDIGIVPRSNEVIEIKAKMSMGKGRDNTRYKCCNCYYYFDFNDQSDQSSQSINERKINYNKRKTALPESAQSKEIETEQPQKVYFTIDYYGNHHMPDEIVTNADLKENYLLLLSIDTLIEKLEKFNAKKLEKKWPLFIENEDSTLGTILEETKCYTYDQKDDGILVHQIYDFPESEGGDGLSDLIEQIVKIYNSL